MLSVQVIGRIARLACVAAAIYIFKNENVMLISVWKAVVSGLPGIAMQLIIIPLVFGLFRRKYND